MIAHQNFHTVRSTGFDSLRRSPGALTALCLALSAWPVTVLGAEWRTEAFIDVASFHDDNAQLTTAPHESTSGYILAPRVNVKRNTETSKLNINGYVAHTNYARGEFEDQTESALDLNGENQLSERNTLGVDGQFRRDTLFQRVDLGPGVGNIRDTDIGLSTSTQVRRTYRTVQPYFNRLLSERSAMRVGYRLTDVTFGNAAGTQLVDYKEGLASADYSYQVSDRDSFTLTGNAARYRPDAGSTESDTVQLLVGMARKFTEATRGSFSIGGSETKQTEPGREERSTGVVFRAGLEQRSDLATFDGVISRDVTPSGIGRSVQSDQIRLRWLRKTSPTIDLGLQVQLLRNQVLEGTAADVDRRYYEVEPELRWHWLDNWIVSGSYKYRKQKFDADPSAADSNAVFLGLTYAL